MKRALAFPALVVVAAVSAPVVFAGGARAEDPPSPPPPASPPPAPPSEAPAAAEAPATTPAEVPATTPAEAPTTTPTTETAPPAETAPAEISPDAWFGTVGLYMEVGPEFVSADVHDKNRTWTPVTGRFGFFGDLPDPETGFYGDFDMSVLFGVILGGVGLDKSAGPFFPGAAEEKTLQYSATHFFRGQAGGAVPVFGPLRVGGNVDVDLGVAQVTGPGQVVDQLYGTAYVAMGIGPSVAFVPFPRLRVYASPNASLMVGAANKIVTGYALDSPIDVLFAVVPRFLDIKGRVNIERRTFFDDVGYDDGRIEGGTFTVFAATVGVQGDFGWVFGI